MINLSDRVPAHYSQRARAELSAAWEHLLTAAQEAARQVGDTSRARGPLARLARRGKLRPSPWRWTGAGLAAGVIIGAVTTAVLTRRPNPADPAAPQQPDDPPSAVLNKARTGAVVVVHRTKTAARTAAKAARDAADKAREKATGGKPAAEPAPPPTTPAADNNS